MSSFPWLTSLVAVPAVGALLVALVPPARGRLAKWLALGVALVVLVLTVVAALAFDIDGARFQLVEQYAWIDSYGVFFALGVDGIALSLVALTAVATPVVMIAMWDEVGEAGPRPRGFFALMLVMEAMTLGAFMSLDVLLFYILFEGMLIPMYFLIGVYGGPQRRYAAMKFILYNLFGGLVMLAAVIGLYVQSAEVLGEGTFLRTELVDIGLTPTVQMWLFLGFMLAFAIKAPLWPFHTWLPDAASEATPSNAAYLSGVVDKVGTYGMVALCLPLFPDASREAAPVVVVLAVISVVYGALLAIGQTDLQRLIAYTSISHFGFIVLGIFALTSQGTSGATFYMVNHGLSTIALFLVVGWLAARRGSRQVDDFGGVQRPAPILAGLFLVAGLSGLALPGLSTFISEFLVLLGTFARYPVAGVVATLGIILASVYILWMYQRTMTGPVTPAVEGMRDARGREVAALAPLIALMLALGFYPAPVLDVIDAGVEQTLQQVGVEDPAPLVPATVAEGIDQ